MVYEEIGGAAGEYRIRRQIDARLTVFVFVCDLAPRTPARQDIGMKNPLLRRIAIAIAFLAPSLPAQNSTAVDPRLYSALTWRNLGPFRAGRVAAVSGAIGQTGVFYIGLPAAGVWKTTSAGESWYPVFDAIKEVSSIGAVEVAPSNANVIYVGTGDIITGGSINEGNGVYKSTDAGRTWTHAGLDATKQIPSMQVDPRDANIVLVGAQGDVHKKSQDRGVYRTTDGGATWTQTLFVDDSTGIVRLARAFDAPQTIFAASVAHYNAPPPLTQPPATPGGGGGGFRPVTTGPTSSKLFKSTDGGVHWTEITGGGLPARLSGKMAVAVAMKTNAQRVFLIGDFGLYRSDDGGATWKQMAADDQRIRNGQGGYNCGVYVSSTNPDIVYTINTSSYVSRDGGNTFTGFKGAPGGDDPQQMWIDPTDGNRILLGLDQGAVVSLDAGATWSSWYNQSTDQIYHVSTDNSFPYWVYGTQQDAGAIRSRSRGNLGEITPLDWNPVPGWEWGTIVPDPLNPNVVYGSGNGITKITYPSEQWINVSPQTDPALKLRANSDQPIKFAPWNPKMLVAGFNMLYATTDSGAHWKALSPDLTIRPDAPPVTSGPGTGAPVGGSIQSIAMSTVSPGIIWVGTNNGLIKITRNSGTSWEDASIPNLPYAYRAETFSMEASHFDAATAYAVAMLMRAGDYTPYIFRTSDYGKTWTRITSGLPVNEPSGSFARVIREDPKKRGLLYAGTESSVYISFNNGDSWQPLRNNLPTTSVRDLTIKDNDLVIATYGRGFWVLDDYVMLRDLAPAVASENAHLFKPGDAVRIRRNVGYDTPFPPEVPHALNPPPGALIDYWLARSPSSDITLDVLDEAGALVRHYSSAAVTPVPEAARPPHPNFWVASPMPLPKNVGGNRMNWDLRYDAPDAFTHSFEINANPGLTPPSPEGPLALPGNYTLKLAVDGRTYTQQLTVKNDPRSPATLASLRAQHDLQMRLVQGMEASFVGHRIAQALRDALRGAFPANVAPELSDASARALVLAAQIDTVAGLDAARGGGGGGGGGRGAGQAPSPSFLRINGALAQQLQGQETGDLAPTSGAWAAYAATCKDLATVAAAWQRLSVTELGAFNKVLVGRGRKAVLVPAANLKFPSCG
jgi:photosystem II stability/assembly factor-like uncharacterized protein